MKTFYKRNLPHIQPPGATLFVTFCLADSIPKRVVEELKQENQSLNKLIQKSWNKRDEQFKKLYDQQKRMLAKYDQYLHRNRRGPHFCKNNQIANLVCTSMKHWDQQKYDLLAYCIMSNHVHVVFTPLRIKNDEYYELGSIMHSIKSYTANEANKILNREGKSFWTDESFDHFCRDEDELQRIIYYVLNNPLKAGLVKEFSQWKWFYVQKGLLD